MPPFHVQAPPVIQPPPLSPVVLGGIGALAAVAIACHLVIVVFAFRMSVWKGILLLLFPPYAIWFALARFTHPFKPAILALDFLGAAGALIVLKVAQAAALRTVPGFIPGQ